MSAELVLVTALAALVAAALLMRSFRRRTGTAVNPGAPTRDPRLAGRQATRRLAEAAGHELHTPLTAILGYQELLADGIYGDLDDNAREAVVRIGRSAQQLMFLIDGLLDALLAESGELELDLEPVDIAGLLHECADSARLLALDRQIDLDTDLPAQLPTLHTDPLRLRRCVELALVAAIRNAPPARPFRFAGRADAGVTLEIGPTALSEAMLHPDLSVRASSDRLSLRLAVALRLARALGGSLELLPGADGHAQIRINIPPAAAPSAD